MSLRKHVGWALSLLLLAAVTLPCAAANPNPIAVASDGHGHVDLFWLPVAKHWPQGGWRLERVAGGKTTVVADHLFPGQNAAAVARLPKKEADGLREFASKLRQGRLTEKEQLASHIILGAKAAVDMNYGNALGLRYRDTGAGRGTVRYRLLELDGRGKPAHTLTSRPVDGDKGTPLPPPPKGLKADSGDQVALFWDKPTRDLKVPTVAWHVARVADGQSQTLTAEPLLLASNRDVTLPAFTDADPPVEAEVTYKVSAIDLFGRRGTPADIKVFHGDPGALVPPKRVDVETRDKQVVLHWKTSTDPYTSGYVVERAFLFSGPYEILTPKGIARDKPTYTDSGLTPGTAYYYRVHAMNPRGDLGPPSPPALAQLLGGPAPAAPSDVKADVGRTRVRLLWKPVHSTIAGYYVERRLEGSRAWERLDSRLTPEPRFDDELGATDGGRLHYRVFAVGTDNHTSKASAEVTVTLPDVNPPEPPHITEAVGEGGKAVLKFAPALPENQTAQILVLRGGSEDDPGVVLGDPLPGKPGTFEDKWVKPGASYWYRLVAVDPAGNRSDPSQAAVVRVGAKPIPAPKAPRLSYAAKPFPRVDIHFAAPPDGLAVVVEVRAGERWRQVAGPVKDETAVDANPTQGTARYRLLYEAGNGARGAPSDTAEVKVP